MGTDVVRPYLLLSTSYDGSRSTRAEFTSVREEIFLRILEAVSARGTAFALPSQTLYMSRDRARPS